MSPENNKSYVYILRCADGTFYTGWTTDPERRAKAHNSGKGAKYTRSRLPVELIYTEEFDNKIDAQRREYAIKRLTRAEKEKLITRSCPESDAPDKVLARDKDLVKGIFKAKPTFLGDEIPFEGK